MDNSELKTLGGPSYKRPSQDCENYLQEFNQVPTINNEETSHHVAGGRENKPF